MFFFTEVPLESITLDTDRALVSEETSGTDVTFSSPSSGHLLTTANTRVILSQNNETHFSGETFRPSYSVSAHPSSTAQLVTISQGGISLGGDQSSNQLSVSQVQAWTKLRLVKDLAKMDPIFLNPCMPCLLIQWLIFLCLSYIGCFTWHKQEKIMLFMFHRNQSQCNCCFL